MNRRLAASPPSLVAAYRQPATGRCLTTREQNVSWHGHSVTSDQRADQKRQSPCVLWFTGFSGAGKSTLANALDERLYRLGYHSFVLDGDNLRHGLSRDLGFSEADRSESVRRAGEVAGLLMDAGLIVIVASIAPFRRDREAVRERIAEDRFIEIHVDAPLDLCEQRDPKGLYRKARAGEIRNFTGIDSPYEAPTRPEIVVDTSLQLLPACVETVIYGLQVRGLLGA